MLIVTLIAELCYGTCLYVRSMEDHQDAGCDEKPADGCPEYHPGPEGAALGSLPAVAFVTSVRDRLYGLTSVRPAGVLR